MTNEVLKRAENALFSRAINAIRPIEIKKICPERQKLYSNESTIGDHDKSPSTSSATAAAAAASAQNDDIQITLVSSDHERSVEIKSNLRNAKTPPPTSRSIKERLGKKLNDDAKSRSRTPQRKFIDQQANRTKSRSKERRHSREHDKRRGDGRDRKHRSPKSDSRRSPPSEPKRNERQKSTDRNGGGRDKERRRNSSESRDRKDGKGKSGARDRDEKDSQTTGTARDEQKGQMEKSTRNTDRDRELDKARVRARIREQERAKAQQGLFSDLLLCVFFPPISISKFTSFHLIIRSKPTKTFHIGGYSCVERPTNNVN